VYNIKMDFRETGCDGVASSSTMMLMHKFNSYKTKSYLLLYVQVRRDVLQPLVQSKCEIVADVL
jgi:hypothetical protein